MRYFCLLSLLAFSACGTDIFSDPPYPKCECLQQLPAATCESAKILCSCVPPEYPPANPATCPEIVFDHIYQVFDTRDWFFYASLLSPDFIFADETIGLEVVGKEPEVRALRRIFNSYRRMQYFPEFSRQYTDDGCLIGCGTVEMLLINHDENFTSGFSVADETCLTVCPGADDLWHLTEWRILKDLPATRKKIGRSNLGRSQDLGCPDDCLESRSSRFCMGRINRGKRSNRRACDPGVLRCRGSSFL